MATNILQDPVANYQILTAFKPPPPWGFVAAEIVRLLRTYSTGLSIAIGADEITAAWQVHRTQPNRPLVYTGTVVRILPCPPELWLIRVQDGSHVAMYPNTAFLKRFETGTVLSFAAKDVSHHEKRSNGVYPDLVELVQRMFRKDSAALRGDHTTLQQARPEKGGSKLYSPSDIGKFPYGRAGPQPADTFSQERSSDDPADRVTSIVSSTTSILFDLNSISSEVLNMSEPMHSYTLQRIWNERCLIPLWIFAVVVDLQLDEGCQIRLQDLSDHHMADQPSVLWKPPPDFKNALSVLRPGFYVLLSKPVVQPTGDSFEVFCSQDTVCYYTVGEKSAGTTMMGGIYVTDSDKNSAAQKRRRVDTILSEMDSVVDTRHVSALVNPASQPNFIAHARVVGAPISVDPLVTVIPCDHNVSIKVTGVEMSRRAACIVAGDEVLLQNMEWVVSEDENSTERGGWVAGSVDNLSMMVGVLNSPIARRILPLKDCFSTSKLHHSGHLGASSFKTFHVLVHVRKLEVCSKDRQVHLKISDEASTGDLFEHAVGDNETSLQYTADRSLATEIYDVVLPEHHFQQLFECHDSYSFWESNHDELVENSISRLQRGRWLMTLTCFPPSSKSPCVRAFVPYQW